MHNAVKPAGASDPGCWSLKWQLRLRILASVVIGIVVVTVLSSYYLGSQSPSWMDVTTNAILAEETVNINRVAQQKAVFLDTTLKQVLADLDQIHNVATDLERGVFAPTTLYQQSYCALTDFGDPIPFPDTTGSLWFIKDVRFPGDLTGTRLAAVRRTSNADSIFRSLWNARGNTTSYQAFFYGLENDNTAGLFRRFPWQERNTYPTLTYQCLRNQQSVTTVGYDSRCRDWYEAARFDWTTTGQQRGVFIPPFIHTNNGKLGIAASKAILNTALDTLLGVVAVDLDIDVMEASINSVRILGQGYAYVINNAGVAILHPNINRRVAPPQINDLEFGTSAAAIADADAFSTHLTAMRTLSAGQGTFNKGGNKWYIAYAPVQSSQWSVAVVVPESAVLAPADDVRSDINGQLGAQIGIFVTIVCIVLALVWIGAEKAASDIAAPVKQLTTYCNNIADGRLAEGQPAADEGKKDVEDKNETKLLQRTFRDLVIALRVGSDLSQSKNHKMAKDVFLEALDMFTRTNNERGMGVCYNALGSICMKMADNGSAESYFNKAIANARALLQKAKEAAKDPKEITALKQMLASRMSNKALLTGKLYGAKQKEAELKEAMDLDVETSNTVAWAIHGGNLGQLYLLEEKNAQKALPIFQHAVQMAEQRPQNDTLHQEDLLVTRQYAYLNLGMCLRELGDYKMAEKYLIQALTFAPVLDENVERTGLTQLSALYRSLGENKRAEDVQNSLDDLFCKDVAFVVDYSGSMAGERFRRTMTNFRMIFDKHCKRGDNVSMRYFNAEVHTAFPLLNKLTNVDRMNAEFKRLSQPEGATAFYDALLEAMDELEAKRGGRQQWVIALTDGEDNKSRHKPDEVEARIKASPMDGLIIVVVGQVPTIDWMTKVCQLTKNGTVFNCEGADARALDSAFEEVSRVLAVSGQMLMEET